jgi:hypothetical protein
MDLFSKIQPKTSPNCREIYDEVYIYIDMKYRLKYANSTLIKAFFRSLCGYRKKSSGRMLPQREGLGISEPRGLGFFRAEGWRKLFNEWNL